MADTITDTPKDWPGLVEFRAQALDPDAWMPLISIADIKKQNDARANARATLIAEYEAGIRHVPAEATEEMLKAFQRTAGRGKDCGDAINAAIAAGAIRPEEE